MMLGLKRIVRRGLLTRAKAFAVISRLEVVSTQPLDSSCSDSETCMQQVALKRGDSAQDLGVVAI